MKRISYANNREQRYGAIWGVVAFGIGVGVTWYFLGPSDPEGPTRFRRAVWLYLSSHYFEIGPVQIASILELAPQLRSVPVGSRPEIWYAIPTLSVAVATAAINEQLGTSAKHEKIIRNSVMVLYGYIPAALLALVWSNAAGDTGPIVLLLGVIFLSLTIGSNVVGRLGTPTFAITSLTGLVIVGLLVVLGGWILLRMLVPVAVSASTGLLLGSAAVFGARRY